MIGVIADDTTGANDIGSMFVRGGWAAKVLTHEPGMQVTADVPATILDIDSRLLPPARAYERSAAAARTLKEQGWSQFHKKTCSVLRGPVGAECDALLDVTGQSAAVLSIAYPANGRKTIDGRHYVHGKPLHESNFANDPVHPMRESDLVKVLAGQTQRRVVSVNLSVVRQGAAKLRAHLEAELAKGGYLIVDGETQDDIRVLAEACAHVPILGGSAALAEELPKVLGGAVAHPGETLELPRGHSGVLIVSGSLTPQTREQTLELISSGTPSFELNTTLLFDDTGRELLKDDLKAQALLALREGRNALIYASQDEAKLDFTRRAAEERGLDRGQLGRLVSDHLAALAVSLVQEAPVQGVVVAGGDTSGNLCRALGIHGNYLLEELEPGVPVSLAMGRPLLLVLKSGSFGSRAFLVKAANRLRELLSRSA